MTDNIEVFTQSSIRITDRAGTIYCDPFRLHGTPKDADYILITHDHYDHFSPEDIEKAATAHTVLVVPENMKGQAKDVAGLVGSVVTVRPGQSYQVGELSIRRARDGSAICCCWTGRGCMWQGIPTPFVRTGACPVMWQ